MKKYIFPLMLILIWVNMIFSLNFNYGFKAGWNYSFLNGDGFKSKYPLYGYLAGIFGEFDFTSYTGVQSGFFLSKKGGTTGEQLNSEQVNVDYGISYLNIPLNFTSEWPVNDIWKLKFNLGGYASYKIDDEFQVQNNDQVTKTEIKIEDYDYGFSVGLGGVFFQHYSLEIQYNRGLMDIFNEYPDNPDINYEMYTNTVSIIVGFYML